MDVKLIEKHISLCGRMIAPSKSGYCRAHPNNTVYFNACIFDSVGTQVWWGDIDLTEDGDKLTALAEECKETFYVAPEHPYRTDFNKVTSKQLKKDNRVLKFGGVSPIEGYLQRLGIKRK